MSVPILALKFIFQREIWMHFVHEVLLYMTGNLEQLQFCFFFPCLHIIASMAVSEVWSITIMWNERQFTYGSNGDEKLRYIFHLRPWQEGSINPFCWKFLVTLNLSGLPVHKSHLFWYWIGDGHPVCMSPQALLNLSEHKKPYIIPVKFLKGYFFYPLLM